MFAAADVLAATDRERHFPGVQGVPKMTPMLFCQISITNGTFSAKFYTHVYSTKIHMLTIFGV